MFRLRRHELVCREAVELVTDYLEGTLSAADRKRFEAHLKGCPHCTAYLAQMRETIAATGRVEPEELAPQARADLIRLYRQWQAG